MDGIRQDMEQLNTYSLGKGHPKVVAIDVAPTEPNSSAASSLVASLPELSYPVAMDNIGNVADVSQARTGSRLDELNGRQGTHYLESRWLVI